MKLLTYVLALLASGLLHSMTASANKTPDSDSKPAELELKSVQIEMRVNGGFLTNGRIGLRLNGKPVLIQKKKDLPLKAPRWVHVLPAKAWFKKGENVLSIDIVKPSKAVKRMAKTPVNLYIRISARAKNAPKGMKKRNSYRYKMKIEPADDVSSIVKKFQYPQAMNFDYVGGDERKNECGSLFTRNIAALERMHKMKKYRAHIGRTLSFTRKSKEKFIHICRKAADKKIASIRKDIARLEKVQ